MFVRDKTEEEDEFFTMAEYCSVLVMAKYIREAGNEFEESLSQTFIPLIRRGELHRMPKEVAEEFDRILQLVVEDIEKAGVNEKEFFSKLEMGEYDPVADVVDAPEMVHAMGNVMMKRLRVTEGLRGEECFLRATEMLPRVKNEMLKFLGGLMMQAFFDLGGAASKQGIPLNKATKILKPRVIKISDMGVMIETRVDGKILKRIAEEKKPEPKRDQHDPSYI